MNRLATLDQTNSPPGYHQRSPTEYDWSVAATKLEMKINEIPDRWHASLDNYIEQHSSPPHFDIGSVPFDDNVGLRFLDGSTAHFFRAFVLRDPAHDELAVFTEHCLHHIFPLTGTEVRITKHDSE